jgi:WD40 repeat protein
VEAPKYRAFLSYSRSDRQQAKTLQARLERYVLPQALRRIKPGMRHDRRPLKPIFRDEDELVPGQDLPERIRRGLEQSEYLIVVCSPRAVASEWVGKEIRDFMALGRQERMLAVVVDGEPNAEARGLAPELECLPRELRFEPELQQDEAGRNIVTISGKPAEPLWVDWRKTNQRDRPMFLRLVAALLTLSSLDELIRKDRTYRRRRAVLFWSAIGAAACCILGLGAGLMVRGAQAESRALSVQALQEADPADALEKAIQAAEKWPTEEAEVALNTVLEGPVVRVILHHSAAISAVGASADGTRLFTANDDGAVYVWDAGSGRLLARLAGPAGGAVDAAMSPDGQRIVTIWPQSKTNKTSGQSGTDSGLWNASGARLADFGNIERAVFSPDSKSIVTVGADGREKVWKSSDGGLELTLSGTSAHPIWIAFSPDSNFVRALDEDGRALAWEAHDGRLISQIALPRDDGNEVSNGGISPDGKQVIVTGYAARLFDAQNGRLLATMAGQDCGMVSAAFSPDGKLIVTVDAHGDIATWDTADYRKKAQLGLVTDPQFAPDGRTVQFSPDGAFLISSSPDNLTTIWDATSGQALGTFRGQTATVTSAMFLGKGDRIATASADKTTRIWDWKGDRAVANLACSAARQPTMEDVPILALMEGDAVWLGISARDGSVASFANGGACVWDLKGGQLLASKKSAGFVKRGAFSSDGSRIATVQFIANSMIWDARSLQALGDVACSKGTVNDLEFSPDAKKIVAACQDGLGILWDIGSPDSGRSLAGHAGAVHRAVFSSDSKRIVTASDDRTARVWDAESRKVLLVLRGHTQPVLDTSFSPDGRLVVTASADGTACVWDAANGNLLATLRGHNAAVKIAQFSPDGKLVVTAGDDHTVRVWNTRDGRLNATLQEVDKITEAEFSPDGKEILTNDSEGVRIWRIADGEPRQLPTISAEFAQFSPDSKQVVALTLGGITSTYLIDFPDLIQRAKHLLPIDAGG